MRRRPSQFSCSAFLPPAGGAAAQTPPLSVRTGPRAGLGAGNHRGQCVIATARFSGGSSGATADVWILATVVGPCRRTSLGTIQLGRTAGRRQGGAAAAARGDWRVRRRMVPADGKQLFGPAKRCASGRRPRPSLKARFVAAREKLHRDADRYEDFLPAWAGLAFMAIFWMTDNLTGDEPTDTVKHLAHAKIFPSRRSQPIRCCRRQRRGQHVRRDQPHLSAQCALDDIEAEDAHQTACGEGVGVGDLAA